MDYRIEHLEIIDSTNKYALDLINSSKAEEGFVIWADEQTQGKGHGSNIWESEVGKSLTFSLVLKPSAVNPGEQFILTQIISVAIRNLVIKFIPEEAVKIKWPNDIYIAHDKVAGILIQNTLSGNKIENSLVGIGLNINQEVFLSGAPNPVSLIHYSSAPIPVENVLSLLLIEINTCYNNLGSRVQLERLNDNYLKNLYRYKQIGKYREGKKDFTATLEGIDEYGRLKLRMEDGKVCLFGFKEVEFVI